MLIYTPWNAFDVWLLHSIYIYIIYIIYIYIYIYIYNILCRFDLLLHCRPATGSDSNVPEGLN